MVKVLGGATSLCSSLKPCKTSEEKTLFQNKGSDHTGWMQGKKQHQKDAFYCKQRTCNPRGAGYTDNFNLVRGGMTAAQTAVELMPSKPPSAGVESYQYVQAN